MWGVGCGAWGVGCVVCGVGGGGGRWLTLAGSGHKCAMQGEHGEEQEPSSLPLLLLCPLLPLPPPWPLLPLPPWPVLPLPRAAWALAAKPLASLAGWSAVR